MEYKTLMFTLILIYGIGSFAVGMEIISHGNSGKYTTAASVPTFTGINGLPSGFLSNGQSSSGQSGNGKQNSGIPEIETPILGHTPQSNHNIVFRVLPSKSLANIVSVAGSKVTPAITTPVTTPATKPVTTPATTPATTPVTTPVTTPATEPVIIPPIVTPPANTTS
jgi:hypothetical protein